MMVNAMSGFDYSHLPHYLSLGAGVQSSTLALMYAVGELKPMPEAAIFAATNPYFTGQVIDIDGGHMIRQYATR